LRLRGEFGGNSGANSAADKGPRQTWTYTVTWGAAVAVVELAAVGAVAAV
jgi:hypothetical protein